MRRSIRCQGVGGRPPAAPVLIFGIKSLPSPVRISPPIRPSESPDGRNRCRSLVAEEAGAGHVLGPAPEKFETLARVPIERSANRRVVLNRRV